MNAGLCPIKEFLLTILDCLSKQSELPANRRGGGYDGSGNTDSGREKESSRTLPYIRLLTLMFGISLLPDRANDSRAHPLL
jgi:hypothetical protein